MPVFSVEIAQKKRYYDRLADPAVISFFIGFILSFSIPYMTISHSHIFIGAEF